MKKLVFFIATLLFIQQSKGQNYDVQFYLLDNKCGVIISAAKSYLVKNGYKEVKVHTSNYMTALSNNSSCGVTITCVSCSEKQSVFHVIQVGISDVNLKNSILNHLSSGLNASVRTTKPVINHHEQLLVEYEGLPGNPDDLVAISVYKAPPESWINRANVGGNSIGVSDFSNLDLDPGRYEARAYFDLQDGTGRQLQKSYPFEVKESPSSAPTDKSKGKLTIHTEAVGCTGSDMEAGIEIKQNGTNVATNWGPKADDKNTFEQKQPPYQFELKPGVYDVAISTIKATYVPKQRTYVPIQKTIEIKAGSELILSRGQYAGNLEIRFFDISGAPLKVQNYKITILQGGKQLYYSSWWNPTEYDAGLLPIGNYEVKIGFTSSKTKNFETQTKQVSISPCQTVTLDFQN